MSIYSVGTPVVHHSPEHVAKHDGRRAMQPNIRIVHFTERQLKFIRDVRIKHGLHTEEAAIRLMIEVAGALDR